MKTMGGWFRWSIFMLAAFFCIDFTNGPALSTSHAVLEGAVLGFLVAFAELGWFK